MYNQFVKNLNHYLLLMRSDEAQPCARYRIGESLLPLTDIALYKALEKKDLAQHEQLSTLIWQIAERGDAVAGFANFSWELWGRGFVKKRYDVDDELLTEQLKIVELLLGTQYWA